MCRSSETERWIVRSVSMQRLDCLVERRKREGRKEEGDETNIILISSLDNTPKCHKWESIFD